MVAEKKTLLSSKVDISQSVIKVCKSVNTSFGRIWFDNEVMEMAKNKQTNIVMIAISNDSIFKYKLLIGIVVIAIINAAC